MPLMPYLYDDPSRIAVRLLGAAVPGEELVSDERAVRAGAAILERAVKEGVLEVPDDILDAVTSYHAAAALAAKSGSPRLIRALVEATGEHARRVLSRSTPDELARSARMLGLPVERSRVQIPWLVERGRVIPLRLEYSVALAHYLRVAAGAGGELSLSNSFLRGGRVYLDRQRLLALASRAAMMRAVSIIDRYREAELDARLVDEALRLAARVESGGGGGLDWDALPECVKRIMGEGASSDEEAYVIVSFLSSVRASGDSAARVLLRSGLASARALENLSDALLALRGYTPYKCSSERGRRVCGESCEGGLLREYYSRRSHRRAQGSRRGARRAR